MLYANDLSNALFAGDTFAPQSLTSTGNGTGVDTQTVGANLLNARLVVNDVTAFTSLDVKMQASTDNTTFVDITGATFTQVVAASQSQIIAFQLPTAASASTNPYRYVRAVATLVGTSCRMAVAVFGLKHFPNPTTGYLAAPPTLN